METGWLQVLSLSVYALSLSALYVLAVLMPARVIQKRHRYPTWVLVFGLIPYLGPVALLWALAVSNPQPSMEEPA